MYCLWISLQASKLSVFFCPIFEGAPLSKDPKPPFPPTTRRESDTNSKSSPLNTASSSNSRCEQASLCSWQGIPSKASMCFLRRDTSTASSNDRVRVLPPCSFTNICMILLLYVCVVFKLFACAGPRINVEILQTRNFWKFLNLRKFRITTTSFLYKDITYNTFFFCYG